MSESFDDTPGFDLGEPPQPARGESAYRVLARKYRPQTFSELIGQDAMVQTLANAIKRDRLAHAFLLTGVRGVGKTSTARLIAKGLNCETGPTIDPCGRCDACVAIAEGRHIDVVEIDAASHNGVDDIREISEAVRYAAVSARYKIYIIDEVHMLSKPAFNAVLKTLEEPPPHVKFLMATTEVQKVPVTVLSRCQRFDLRRIAADQLAAHFANIAKIEGVEAEGEALALIARAAEGSVRDGLSILDQAIAHAGMDADGRVTADQVRTMLGLSDRGAIRVLFGHLLDGNAMAALAALAEQHALGVDPAAVMKGLLDTCHATTLAKVGAPADPAQSAEERDACSGWAASLGFAMLHRLWQLLLKGHDEVAQAPDPREAADMALLRVVHASQLPDPGALARTLESGVPLAAPSPGAVPGPQASAPSDFAGLIDLLGRGGKPLLAQQLHDYVGLVSYAPGALVIRPSKPLPGEFARDAAAAFKDVTGIAWRVDMADAEAAPSLRAQEEAEEAAARDAILATPAVKAAFDAFPDAELVDYDRGTERRTPA
jgi:DNA polymerase III subunit gamma/tau